MQVAGSKHCSDMKDIILEKEIVHVVPAVSEGNSLITNSQVIWLHLVEVVDSSRHNQDAEKLFVVHYIWFIYIITWGNGEPPKPKPVSHHYKNKVISVSSPHCNSSMAAGRSMVGRLYLSVYNWVAFYGWSDALSAVFRFQTEFLHAFLILGLGSLLVWLGFLDFGSCRAQVLYYATLALLASGHETVYDAVEQPLLFAQTAALLEVPWSIRYFCNELNTTREF